MLNGTRISIDPPPWCGSNTPPLMCLTTQAIVCIERAAAVALHYPTSRVDVDIVGATFSRHARHLRGMSMLRDQPCAHSFGETSNSWGVQNVVCLLPPHT
jgi:hypothetical protein